MRLRNWFLVQCKPRQDERAEENLIRQGYRCARPKLIRQGTPGDKPKTDSLFPGYLFIQMPEGANWSSIRSTRGVSHVVSFGGRFLPVSDDLVQYCIRRSEVKQSPTFKADEFVHIVSGTFAEIEAVFLEMDGIDRVMLLIKLLNRQQKVSVPIVDIRAS